MQPWYQKRKGKYLFIIANTDSAGKSGIHWWSILDIEPKTDTFLFASFGLDGLQHFIIQDDKKVTEKILFGTENKIMLVNIRFNLNACKNLSKRELDALSKTATNFFILSKLLATSSICDFINIWMVEDRMQDLNSVLVVLFNCIFTATCLILMETAKYKTKQDLTKEQ